MRKSKAKRPRDPETIEEAVFDHDEDYLFTRKADKYMFVLLDPTTGTWDIIKETENGPKQGHHWGEIRLSRDLMYLVAFKLMTLDPADQNPFSDRVVEGITEDIVNLFDDISMIACDLKE